MSHEVKVKDKLRIPYISNCTMRNCIKLQLDKIHKVL